jgi:hypothetical protein
MKIGLVGQADGGDGRLRDALDFLVKDADVDLVIYLGNDEHIASAAHAHARGSAVSDAAFLSRVAREAPRGNPQSLGALLDVEETAKRLDRIRRLPPPPARAIEMLGDRIVTLVWDKAVLGEEDIANSFVLVYGRSKELLFKRFGPRYFFTPGPLSGDRVAVLEQGEEDGFSLAVFTTAGVPITREALQARTSSKVMVSP